MDFITDLFNKIVKLVFDILAVFGIDAGKSPVQPEEETDAEA